MLRYKLLKTRSMLAYPPEEKKFSDLEWLCMREK